MMEGPWRRVRREARARERHRHWSWWIEALDPDGRLEKQTSGGLGRFGRFHAMVPTPDRATRLPRKPVPMRCWRCWQGAPSAWRTAQAEVAKDPQRHQRARDPIPVGRWANRNRRSHGPHLRGLVPARLHRAKRRAAAVGADLLGIKGVMVSASRLVKLLILYVCYWLW
jgi:hypothetical protein